MMHHRVLFAYFSKAEFAIGRYAFQRRLTAWAVAAVILPASNAGAQGVDRSGNRPAGVTDQVAAQIAALTEEKLNRTPGQRKIDSQFLYAARSAKGERPARGVPMQQFDLKRAKENASRIQVEIKGKVTAGLLKRIGELNGTVITSYPDFGSVLAWMSLDQLEALATHPDVRFLGLPPVIERDTGVVNSQGDRGHAADTTRSRFPVDTSGLKIGVISDSASPAGIASSVSGSEFAPGQVTVVPGQDGGAGSDEGIAMMEIINDVCPGAQLFFATSGATQASFASNILTLRNTYGCDIIVDDIRMSAELPFQDGPIARAVNTVSANGAVYFASAGNSGSKTNNTSGTWVGDFVDGGALTITVGGSPVNYRVHSFRTSPTVQNFNVVQSGGSSYSLSLFWSDPEGGSTNDYDVFQLNSEGTSVISQSTNVQNGTQDPFENTTLNGAGGNRIIIVKREGAQNRALYLSTGRGRLSINTNGFARGHSAAPGAIATAAVPAAGAQVVGAPAGPFPNSFAASQLTERFSSDGPARKFHNPDGSPVTPGNFLIGSGGGSSQLYPVLTAADGVSTSVPGFAPFYGTSAAAPHAAAMAGLLKAYKPALTPVEIRGILTGTALDIQAVGTDNDTGFGIVRPLQALISVTLPPAVAVTGPIHQSSVAALTTISGTATDPNGLPFLLNRVSLTLFHVPSGDYWTGTSWTQTQTTLHAPVNAGGAWSLANLPAGANARSGQFALSVSTANSAEVGSQPQSGVNNILFTVDNQPPAVAITGPATGSTITSPGYPFSGTTSDKGGIERVVLFIRRLGDNLYWDGGTWIAEPLSANLSSSYNPVDGSWACDDTLPVPGSTLSNGNYDFIALSFDKAGNTTQADSLVSVDFHQIYQWTAGSHSDLISNNNDFYWDNPANWSPNGIPGSEDIVNIGLNHVVRSSVPRIVHGFNMSTGGLDFDNAGHSLTIRNSGVWSGGTLDDVVNLQPGVVFALSGNTQKMIGNGGVLNNQGTVIWTAGTLGGYQNSTFNNKSGASFIMSGDGDVFSNWSSGNVFNNEAGATFSKISGAENSSSYIDEWTFNNNGSVQSQQGTLHFNTTLNLNTSSAFGGAGRILLNGTTHLNTALISTGNPELVGVLNCNAASFSGTHPFVWSNGEINGAFTLAAGSVLELTTGSIKQIGSAGVFTNFGRINWSQGLLRGYQNSTLNNEAGGVFDVTTDGDVFSNWSTGNIFNNKAGGLFLKSGKSAVPDSESFLDEWTFNNSGVIRSDTGNLRFHTVLNLNGGGTISRTGAAAARVRSTSSFVLTGTTTVNNIAFEAAGDWSGNTAPGTAGDGTIATIGGGLFDWTAGTVYNTVSITAGSTFTLSGPAQKSIGISGVLNNFGNATWSGPGNFEGRQNSTFTNRPGSSFTTTSDADLINYSTGNVFANMTGASFQKTGGSENNRCDWAFDNNGTVTVSSGALALNGGGTSGGTFAPATGGTLQFTNGIHSLITTAAIQGTGRTQFLGGTVTAVNPVNAGSSATTLDIAGGILNSAPAGSFTAVGTVNWSDGEIGGTFHLKAGSQIHLTTGAVKRISGSGVINNSGAATWQGPGLLQGYQNSTWNNKAGSSFMMLTDGDVFSNWSTGNVFNNETGASFVKNAGSAELSSYIDEWTVNNNGSIQSQQGTLYFNTTLNLNTSSAFGGAGRILLNGTTNLNAALTSTGNPELVGTLNGNAASFSGTHPFVWSSGEINGAFTLAAGSVLELTTGNVKQIGTAGVFTNFGRINWRQGLLRGYQNSTLNNETGGIFDATADGDVFSNWSSGNVFNNKTGGLFIKSSTSGGSTYIDEWAFNNSGVIRSDSGLLQFNTALDLRAGGSIARVGAAPARVLSSHYFVLTGTAMVNNITFETVGDWYGNTAEGTAGNGTLATQSGGVFEWTGGTVHNTVNIAAGSLFSLTGGNQKQIGGGSVLNNAGVATWSGSGNFQGYQNSSFINLQGGVFNVMTNAPFTNYSSGNRLTNHGVLNIGSPLGISPLHWNFTQSPAGRLNLDIGGTNAATPDFDQLNINGDAVLAGTLRVSLANGYAPLAGTVFPVVTFGSRSGSFDSVLGPGAIWGSQYTLNNLTLLAKTYPTTHDEWVSYFFADPDSPDAQPFADPDHDGMTNLFEYAFGRDPHVGNGSATATGTVEIGEEIYLTLTFTRPTGDAALTDVTYSGQRSAAMAAGTWSPTGVVTHSVVPVPGEPKETVTLRSIHPVGDAAKEFLQLKVGVGE